MPTKRFSMLLYMSCCGRAAPSPERFRWACACRPDKPSLGLARGPGHDEECDRHTAPPFHAVVGRSPQNSAYMSYGRTGKSSQLGQGRGVKDVRRGDPSGCQPSQLCSCVSQLPLVSTLFAGWGQLESQAVTFGSLCRQLILATLLVPDKGRDDGITFLLSCFPLSLRSYVSQAAVRAGPRRTWNLHACTPVLLYSCFLPCFPPGHTLIAEGLQWGQTRARQHPCALDASLLVKPTQAKSRNTTTIARP